MEPKYKVGNFFQYYNYDNTVGTMRVDFIEHDKDGEPIYCKGTKNFYSGLHESDVIGVLSHDEEEYQLYLKLKEKYE